MTLVCVLRPVPDVGIIVASQNGAPWDRLHGPPLTRLHRIGHSILAVTGDVQLGASAAEMAQARPAAATVAQLAAVAADCFLTAAGRAVDDRLRGYYGFTRADLDRGAFVCGGEEVPISQPQVRAAADAIVSGQGRQPAAAFLYQNGFVLLGGDAGGETRCAHWQQPALSASVADGPWLAVGDGQSAARARALWEELRPALAEGSEPAALLLALIGLVRQAVGWNCAVDAGLVRRAGPQFEVQLASGNAALLLAAIDLALQQQLAGPDTAHRCAAAVLQRPDDWRAIERQWRAALTGPAAYELLVRGYSMNALNGRAPSPGR